MALSADSDLKLSRDEVQSSGDGDSARDGAGPVLKIGSWLIGIAIIVGGLWIGVGDQVLNSLRGEDGEVPVISAEEAPVKVKPENPGGMNVPNQDRLVYGIVDGTSTQPRIERLLPPTEKPVAVEEVLNRGVPEASQVVTQQAPRGSADAVAQSPTVGTSAPKPAEDTSSNAPTRLTPVAPVAPAPPPVPVKEVASAPTVTAPSASPSVQTPATQSSVASNPTPAAPQVQAPKPVQPKPAAEPARQARATPAPEAPTSDLGKSFRIQLAAARSENAVRSEWERLRRRHVDLLGELVLQVTRIDLGKTKGIFYRLRAGPLNDAAAARTLCQRLKQRKLGCLVVKPGA